MKTVIITDGKYRSAIAAARVLGRAGHPVVVTQTKGDCKSTPPVFASRYVAGRWIEGRCKDEDYADRLLDLLAKYDRPVLLCVGADSLNRVSRERARFEAVCDCLIADPQVLDALNDKEAVHQRAAQLGLPVPRQYPNTPDSFPVVIKPHCGEKFGLKAADRYVVAQNEADFPAKLAAMTRYDPQPIIQQKVEGDGAGACLLMGREGQLLAALCHRRVREYPITGGPSTCCVSFYDEGMIAQAHALLKSFGFCGLAMVEFKGNYILEVNPRIWGSFPLTACADSPMIVRYAAAAAGQPVTYQAADFQTGVRMRFLLNDTVAILHYLKAGRLKTTLTGLADIFRAKEALWDRKDPRPFWQYLKTSVRR